MINIKWLRSKFHKIDKRLIWFGTKHSVEKSIGSIFTSLCTAQQKITQIVGVSVAQQ